MQLIIILIDVLINQGNKFMAYKRITESEWYIEQYTCNGWEEVCCQPTRREYLDDLSAYRKEGYLVRGKHRRVKLDIELSRPEDVTA